jgi:hypothetical protein
MTGQRVGTVGVGHNPRPRRPGGNIFVTGAVATKEVGLIASIP